MMASPNVRENLVNTAVKFLQNPKIQDSPFTQKRTFLEKKGLTEDEINLAIERSGINSDEGNLKSSSGQVFVKNTSLNPIQQPVVVYSGWTRYKDIAFTTAFLTGAAYYLYRFIKRTVLPFLRGEDSEEQKLKKLEKNITQMHQTLAETLTNMSTTLSSIDESMSKQQEKLQTLVHEVLKKQQTNGLYEAHDQQNVTEIKSEISSLKSLLLSRRQFPPIPQTSPVIPSWQLEDKKESPDLMKDTSEDNMASSGNESGSPTEEKSSWEKIEVTEKERDEKPAENESVSFQESGHSESLNIVETAVE